MAEQTASKATTRRKRGRGTASAQPTTPANGETASDTPDEREASMGTKDAMDANDPNPKLTKEIRSTAGLRGRAAEKTPDQRAHIVELMKLNHWQNKEAAEYFLISPATIGKIAADAGIVQTRGRKRGSTSTSSGSVAAASRHKQQMVMDLEIENEMLKKMLQKHLGVDLSNQYPATLVVAYTITKKGVERGIGENVEEATQALTGKVKDLSEDEISIKVYQPID